jgi:hypothetical protein
VTVRVIDRSRRDGLRRRTAREDEPGEERESAQRRADGEGVSESGRRRRAHPGAIGQEPRSVTAIAAVPSGAPSRWTMLIAVVLFGISSGASCL